MTLKHLLGLDDVDISDVEIMAKFAEAQKKMYNEVEFVRPDGSRIKILIPGGNGLNRTLTEHVFLSC